MNRNMLPSEAAAVAAVIDPDVTAAGTVVTGWVSMAEFGAIMAIVMAGTLGSNATVDAKLEQATDSSGTGAKDVTDTAGDTVEIEQLTEAGTDSDKQAVINCKADDLDVNNGFDHVRLSITVGTATSDAAGLVIGMSPRHAPASDYDASTVDEIVSIT